jgi:hypothetical protein
MKFLMQFTMPGLITVAGLIWIACDRLLPSDGKAHWPLEGAHATLDCASCHPSPLGPVPADCASCHIEVRPSVHYDGPCSTCHQPTAWWDWNVDHRFFLLADSHAVACESCHTTSDTFTGLNPNCTSCHEEDRPDPNHNLGRECGECHSLVSWDQVDHEHQCKIPHNGVSECSDCHLASTSEFSCTHCHEHRKSEMDDEHRGEDDAKGYVWESVACLNCHQECKE